MRRNPRPLRERLFAVLRKVDRALDQVERELGRKDPERAHEIRKRAKRRKYYGQ